MNLRKNNKCYKPILKAINIAKASKSNTIMPQSKKIVKKKIVPLKKALKAIKNKPVKELSDSILLKPPLYIIFTTIL